LKDTLVIFLIILVVTLSCAPLFKNIHNINLNWDWLQMLSYYRFARQSILEDHQFPLRTHYFGGGYPLLANPQDGSLNPFFIPVFIFGEVIGLKISVFLFHIIGALGMYYLARFVLKYNYLGALFSSLVFCLAGHAHRLLIRGQDYIPTSFYFFIPIAVALFIKTKEHKRFIIFSILIFTIIITQAGLYFAPLLLFIFLYCCLESFKFENKKFVFETVYLKNFFMIVFLSLLLGAVKIFPMLELLRQNPRHMDSYNPFWGPLFPNIYKAFFVHQKNFSFPGEHWNYFYIGFLPVIFSFASILIFWRKNARYLILLIIFVWLTFSARTPLDLFRLLWRLPVFHSIEAPTRYFVSYVIFLFALMSGSFFLIPQKLKVKPTFLILIAVTVFVASDLFFTNSTRDVSFPIPIPKYNYQKNFFSVKSSEPGREVSPLIPKKMFQIRSWEWTRPTQYELMLQNIGKINAYVNIHLEEYATPKYYIAWNGAKSLEPNNYVWYLNPNYKGEIYFLNKPNNTAEFMIFSPNKIIAKVNVLEPDTLIVNQNYDKSWKSDLFTTANYNGLLAMKLEKKGEYLVQLTYLPLSLCVGLIVTSITLIFIIFYLIN
jgi:hypothetical protein